MEPPARQCAARARDRTQSVGGERIELRLPRAVRVVRVAGVPALQLAPSPQLACEPVSKGRAGPEWVLRGARGAYDGRAGRHRTCADVDARALCVDACGRCVDACGRCVDAWGRCVDARRRGTAWNGVQRWVAMGSDG
eukprot:2686617-Prymnesium_polylepis.1